MSGLVVTRIDPVDSAALRREVLRGGRDVPLPGDEAPAHHVGVYDGPMLVATGNVRHQPAPWRTADRVGLRDGLGDWRIRGMATSPSARGRGAGRLVLDALLAHARGHQGALVWCNARTPAQGFYELAGFQTLGEPWEEPEIGQHVRMWLAV